MNCIIYRDFYCTALCWLTVQILSGRVVKVDVEFSSTSMEAKCVTSEAIGMANFQIFGLI
ncbi:hypothetical protein [Elizabethkingia anophelis]|uniref:hypothetical protein n=1 Tax=Elizabethkingia anophelis TaxID=1117645 RepID=UPI0016237379|nr:hypothetical protein [Elizabethkingia anophelis]MCT4323304.1 hypothetical protein [Elizabethkingia anophelis]HAY3536227.1 hypothetical protein [Elizabethkingia anophelis]HAY3548444.1 hypothetical protein [Elizabethkingia anophelis]HAY3593188.1 hypothetical protein [Elizabethkingia anophelis]